MRNNIQNDRRYRKKLRLTVIQMLGGKCVYCGCDIPEALEINHINGGGKKEKLKKGFSSTGLQVKIKNHERSTDDLELTCIVCNAKHKAVKIKGLTDNWTILYNKRNESR